MRLKLWNYSIKSVHVRKIEVRRIFSKTGIWKSKLSREDKKEMEEYWKDKVLAATSINSGNEDFYVLAMFPYPSGKLHMGHVRVYTMSDSLTRFYAMNGKKVLHPIGWDAFGLPAENAAIQHGAPPAEWTRLNIESMREQLKSLRCNFNWDREIATNDPNYYKWTQWLFLKLYEKGFTYQKEAWVNWDPQDETVLANEQVDEEGKSWRSGAIVEKRLLRQWFIREAPFSHSLYQGLVDNDLAEWKDIVEMQKHWIGEPTGVEFYFKLMNERGQVLPDTLSVWTENPEFMEYSAFVGIKPSHYLNQNKFLFQPNQLNLFAVNPLNGQKLPVYIRDDELAVEAYLGIPGLKALDSEFCIAHGLPMSKLPSAPNVEVVLKKAAACGAGGYKTSSKLRDWLISRQRYWGTPIPIINCTNCGVLPVPYSDLPVVLPHLSTLTGKGKSALLGAASWLNTPCPKCGGDATRETDTMDTFVDSSWYYLRFLDPFNSDYLCNPEIAKKLLPVNVYVGGKEHE